MSEPARPSDPSDQELIQLVQEKSPSELSDEEIDLLRRRLQQSPQLQEVLIGQLHLEAYLSAALGRFEVSVDDIVRAAAVQSNSRLGQAWRWALLFLATFGAISMLLVALQPEEDPPAPVAADPAEPPAVAAVDPPPQTTPPGSKVPPKATTETTVVPPAPRNPAVPDGPDARPGRRELEAEAFQRGDVVVDKDDLGRDIGILRAAADPDRTFVEYDLELPGGRFELALRYASAAPSPLKLSLNGTLIKPAAGAETTGNWQAEDQRWFVEGNFDFVSGKNVLRLEPNPELQVARPVRFPALDKLALTPVAAAPTPVPSNPPPASTGPEPWDDVVLNAPLEDAAAGVSYAALLRPRGFPEDELKLWLAPVPGKPFKTMKRPMGQPPVEVSAFEGLMRLRTPWLKAAALQMSAFEHHGLKLHLWKGTQGITLRYYQHPRPTWAAYTTTRTNADVVAPEGALVATDDGRYERLGPGAIELRHQEGMLLMARGGVRLLTIPFPAAPDEVYLDGKAWFDRLALIPAPQWGEEIPAARPFVLRSAKPGQMNWNEQVTQGATVGKDAGVFELAGLNLKQPATASLPLNGPGLYEVILLVEDALPGSGVFLGDAQGKPLYQVGFFREEKSKSIGYWLSKWGDPRVAMTLDINQLPVPFAARQQWLRLVLGHGSLKCWTSGDGLHWSRACDPLRNIPGGFESVGLYAVPGDGERRIRLKKLEVRELAGLTGIVAPELRERAPVIPGNLEVAAWLQTMLELNPSDVDPVAWRQACALKTLGQGTWGNLGRVLLNGLVADVVAQPRPLEQKLACLSDALLIADSWEGEEVQDVQRWYERLGVQLVRGGEERPYSVLGPAFRTAPFWTSARIQAVPEALTLHELFGLLVKSQWADLWQLTEELDYWNRASQPDVEGVPGREAVRRMVVWAKAHAGRNLPDRSGPAPILAREWRHPVVENLSKEGYNILAEFESALENQAFKDACQIVVASGSDGNLGLLPDAQDRRLLVSLPRAVALAMRAHPPLQAMMNETFGPVGKLRVRQAQADGDVSAVQAATVQFTGTAAAAEAHRWLGDRALAAGSFALAVGQYQQARKYAPAQLRSELTAKLRLTHAMLGEEFGEAPKFDVEIGGARMTPTDFEKLVGEMRQQHARTATNVPGPATEHPATDFPAPAALQIGRRMGFDGDLGQNAGNAAQPGVDAVGRDYAAVVAGGMLYISNRFQLNAYDLAAGQRKWGAGLGGEQGDARSWPMRPMKPVVVGNRVFIRRLTKHGPEIACLDAADGKVLWNRRPGEHAASEPLVVQDAVYVLSVEPPQGDLLTITLVKLDAATGAPLERSPLMEIRDAWSRQIPCDAVAIDDKIVAQIGGSVICCDLFGQPRWLRRQVWLPAHMDPNFFPQHRQPPLIVGSRLFTAQPGTPDFACLDLESGRVLWRQIARDFRRFVGPVGTRMVVERANGLQAYDLETGAAAWFQDCGPLLEAQLASDKGILCTLREPLPDGQFRPAFVWLHPSTGREVARAPLDPLAGKQPMLGPLVVAADRMWVGFGPQEKEPRREWLELLSVGPPAPGAQVSPLVDWTPHVGPILQTSISSQLPGWAVLTAQPQKKSGLLADPQKQRRLVTHATRKQPALLVRQVTLPSAGSPQLQVQTAPHNGHPWRLGVRVNAQSVLDESLDGRTPPEGRRFDIDLSPYAGRTISLVVSQSTDRGEGGATWSRLQIID